MVAEEIDHKLALTLAIETVNGMSKTAPIANEVNQVTLSRLELNSSAWLRH
jgi:hypothetical protein